MRYPGVLHPVCVRTVDYVCITSSPCPVFLATMAARSTLPPLCCMLALINCGGSVQYDRVVS